MTALNDRRAILPALRRQGWTAGRIGAALSVPESTIRNWTNGGRRECGSWLDGSCGAASPTRCEKCAQKEERRRGQERRQATRDRYIAEIQRFYREHGRAPISTDFRNGARKGLNLPDYPWAEHIIETFGSWKEALEAAGLVWVDGRKLYQMRKREEAAA